MATSTKTSISHVEITVSIGFLYWAHEHTYLRGLKGKSILEYPHLVTELYKEYNTKYPNGLTGWAEG